MDDPRRRFLDKIDREKEHKKQLPGDDDPALPDPVQPIHSDKEPGRNDPCPCGSGKKFKKCCGKS